MLVSYLNMYNFNMLTKGVSDLNMLNSYLTTLKFEIDGGKYTESQIALLHQGDANLEKHIIAQGNTFDELWNFMEQKEIRFFGYRHDKCFLRRRREIEFNYFSDIPSWKDDGTKREWTISIIDKPYKISMKELMKQDADLVIEYIKERELSFFEGVKDNI